MRPAGAPLLGPNGSSRPWRRLRLFVLDRDGWLCQVPVVGGRIDPAGRPCLAPASTVDHVVSRAKGGNDDPDNLRAACGPHNFGKGARLDAEVAAGVRSPAWNW